MDYLRTVDFFKNLNDTHLEEVHNICKRKKVPAGTILFREKDYGSDFYILISGSIKIYTTNQHGEEKIISVFKPGDSFGELSLIDGGPRSATAQTMEESVLLILSADDFLELLRNNFEINLCIMRELCRRLRDTNQHVHDLTFLDPRTRVIKNLIVLANKYGERRGQIIHIKMPLNFDELALMAGVRKNDLMSVVRELEEKQLLILSPHEFTLDLTKLRST